MLTENQKIAVKALNDALGLATDSGLFDSAEAWDTITPDVINAFCDGVAELAKE